MEVHIHCIEGLAKGRVFSFRDREILIGRSSRCDLTLDSEQELGVSGQHCRITIQDDGTFLTDLDSTNGTLVAGRLIKSPTRLKDGATFRLGPRGPIFRFEISGPPKTRSEALPHLTDAVPGGGDPLRPWRQLFYLSVAVILVGLVFLAWRRLS